MREDIAIKWAEALESGNYKQSAENLCTEDGYCCLGVLCEIAANEGIVKKDIQTSKSIIGNHYRVLYDECSALLPNSVIKWAAMQDDAGARKGRKRPLVHINDASGYSFKRIAKIIRSEWKDL